MVKLGMAQGKKGRSNDCKSRRFMPLEVEPDMTMVMALDDFCIACGPTGKKKQSSDVDHFMRNYSSLDKDELAACLMVSWDESLDVLNQCVQCVGCRRSIESLYHSLKDCEESALDPIIVTKDGLLSVTREHMNAPGSLANLFCHQISRLTQTYVDAPAAKKGVVKRGGRCPAHTLEQKKITSCGSWLDTWDCMEKECKEEVVLLPFASIRVTLEKYLKKHSFCCECANMVNKAFTLLIEEGKEPARAAGEKTGEDRIGEDGARLNEDGSVNLFSGISACTKDAHVHVQCDPGFISQLLVLAEPELSGLKQERHAKTIEIAQKEVLICIGITLFNRFNKIQQKLREGEQTCELLCLVTLRSLRKSMDIAAERKRGVTDLELLCQEIEQIDRDKERKQAKKREKKSKQQQKKKEQKCKSCKNEDANESSSATAAYACSTHSQTGLSSDKTGSGHSCSAAMQIDSKENGSVSDSDSGLGSGYSGHTSPLYSRDDWMKGGSPELGLDEPPTPSKTKPSSSKSKSKPLSVSNGAVHVNRSNGHVTMGSGCHVTRGSGHVMTKPVMKWPAADHDYGRQTRSMVHEGSRMSVGSSLLDLDLEVSEDELEDSFISPEEIQQFKKKVPQLNTQRQQLRANLREKFAAMCDGGYHN